MPTDTRLVVDCTTGETKEVPLTKAEQAEVDRVRAADTGKDPEAPPTETERVLAALTGAGALDVAVAAKVLRVDPKRIEAAAAELAAEPGLDSRFTHLPPPPASPSR